MKHVVIIRLKYPKDSPKWDWRIAFFKAMVMPFWERQTDKNFDLWVMCNDWHVEEVKAISPLIYTFNTQANVKGDPDFTKKYGEGGSVQPHECDYFNHYDIQTRVDSDEIPNYDFVETIHKYMNCIPCLLSFKRIRFHVPTMRAYKIENPGIPDYHAMSSVLSLHWPGEYIYQMGHKYWARHVVKHHGQVKVIDFGHVYCGSAWDNADARLRSSDVPATQTYFNRRK